MENIEREQAVKEVLVTVANEFKKEVEPKIPVAPFVYKGHEKIKGGKLKASIKTLYKKNVKRGYLRAWVGYSRPNGAPAHLVDKGTKSRTTKKGWSRGSVEPRLFHTGTFNKMFPQLQARLAQELERITDNIWKD